LITPRSENFRIEGLDFYNYDFTDSAAIGQCSHCFHDAATDSGARTVRFSRLHFDAATVPRRIRWQVPYRGIFLDLDGSLTELGPNTWATPYKNMNEQPECTVDLDVYDGIICDDTVQVRRVVFYNYKPDHFRLMAMKLAKWDADIEEAMRADEDTWFDFTQDVNHEYYWREYWKAK